MIVRSQYLFSEKLIWVRIVMSIILFVLSVARKVCWKLIVVSVSGCEIILCMWIAPWQKRIWICLTKFPKTFLQKANNLSEIYVPEFKSNHVFKTIFLFMFVHPLWLFVHNKTITPCTPKQSFLESSIFPTSNLLLFISTSLIQIRKPSF